MKEMIYDAVFEQLEQVDIQEDNTNLNIDILKNVSTNVEAQVGSAKLTLRDILSLQEGNILKLNKCLSEGITITVNNKKMLDSAVIKVNNTLSLKVKDFY